MAEQQQTSDQEETAADSEAVQKKAVDASAAAPSGPNQKLIFLVLILNTVVLIALAAIFWVSNSKRQGEISLGDIATSKEAPSAVESHGEGKGEHGEKKEGEEENDNFIKESFTVNLADPKGSHFAKVDVEIEVDDQFVKDEVNRLRPKIRDFILVVLSSKSYDQIESVDGRDFLREEIRNKINGYLSRGKIKNVYFTQFIIQ